MRRVGASLHWGEWASHCSDLSAAEGGPWGMWASGAAACRLGSCDWHADSRAQVQQSRHRSIVSPWHVGSSRTRNWTHGLCLAGRFPSIVPPGKPHIPFNLCLQLRQFSFSHLFLAACYHMHWEIVSRTFEHFAVVIILLKSKDFFQISILPWMMVLLIASSLPNMGFHFPPVIAMFSMIFLVSSHSPVSKVNVTSMLHILGFCDGSTELLVPISESVIYCHSSAAWRMVNPNDTHRRIFLSASSSVDLLLLLLRAGLSRAPASKVSSESARWLCWFWMDSLMHLGLQLGQLLDLAVLHLFSRRPAWSCFHGEAEGQEEEQEHVRLFERQPWKQHKSLPLCAIEWRKS